MTTHSPPSPGVGLRRKGPKSLPRLPLSAFSPPNSVASEKFPLAPSPSTLFPETIVDANVAISNSDLSRWKTESGQALAGRTGGVVLALQGDDLDIEKTISELSSSSNTSLPILSVIVPFNLQDPIPATLPSYLSSPKIPISFSAVFSKPAPEGVPSMRWALEQGYPIDIDVVAQLTRFDAEAVWESFEDLLTKATENLSKNTPIILSNVLPPPHDLNLPIVKLMNHPAYRAYQAQTAALSLFPNVYIKFLPPAWNAPTPASAGLKETPLSPMTPMSPVDPGEKQRNEWKRRIKMYLGPALEAFGYQRIIFGSSPSTSSNALSHAGNWYEIARESFTEMSVEQEAIDAVFGGNAKRAYAKQ